MSLSPLGNFASTDPDARERWLIGESQVLSAIAMGAPLREILTGIVQLVESQDTEMIASILLLDEDGCMRLGAAPSLPTRYLNQIEGLAIGPQVGSCGTAMYRREAVISSDISTDPLWEAYRDCALECGLHASWSWPILASDGSVLGALAQYYRNPCEPTPYDLHLITVASRLAGLAITRSRELEDANRRLQEISRLKDQFVNLVAHELRPPLTSIRGYAEFLSEGIGGALSNTQQDFVTQIHLGADRLVSLVDDLLDYSRMDAGTFKLFPKETNLSDPVKAVLESFVPQAHRREVTIKAELPDEPLTLTIDPRRFVQILSNLVGNAMKYTPPEGTITVRLLPAQEGARVEVIDTGAGIATTHLPYLFERFYQANPADSAARGTGLGLFISKVLVEAHGGRIGVDSEPGKGSTFWFTMSNVTPQAVLPDGE